MIGLIIMSIAGVALIITGVATVGWGLYQLWQDDRASCLSIIAFIVVILLCVVGAILMSLGV